jgi:DNA-binding NarL/FixJ family response regulator
MKTNPIRILVFDDHTVVREGLVALIATQPDIEVIGGDKDGSKALDLYRKHKPDVVLMDLGMPNADGQKATAAICKEFPNARILILTVYEGDEDIYRTLQAGARGYLFKESLSSQLFDAIRAVHSGRRYIPPDVASRLAERIPASDLTSQELNILKHIASGKSNKEIASDLKITEPTVKWHVTNILTKLGVGDRTEAVTVALKRGIIHLDS